MLKASSIFFLSSLLCGISANADDVLDAPLLRFNQKMNRPEIVNVDTDYYFVRLTKVKVTHPNSQWRSRESVTLYLKDNVCLENLRLKLGVQKIKTGLSVPIAPSDIVRSQGGLASAANISIVNFFDPKQTYQFESKSDQSQGNVLLSLENTNREQWFDFHVSGPEKFTLSLGLEISKTTRRWEFNVNSGVEQRREVSSAY